MDDFIHAIIAATRLGIVLGVAGAIFCFGIAVVGRWLKWAPINIIVNVNQYGEDAETRS